ncbi:MAG TPA: nucleoside transporter C-terminal domain-containing protein [Polyangiaceae bacterium]|nr:nucleoside transporter C-terminal domain-containing protein [Polyangiaceae bacterium]
MRERLLSGLGVLVLLGLAFAFCPRERRASVQRRTILGGLGLLAALGVLLLDTPLVRGFGVASAAVERLLGFTREGARFVFGPLAESNGSFGYVFAFQVLPTILFFSALMSVLYHLRILPWVIERGGRMLSKLLGVSGAESFSTVADVFVGQAEAPLAVRPYVAKMTLSELNACMVAGFATTAGGVLAAYVAMLSGSVPGIAGHLLASSVMSAPASLVIAKLMLPESERPETTGELTAQRPHASANLLDALVRGTLDGVRLAVNVAAMLIVFLAFTALFDALLASLGQLLGLELNLTRVLSWLFAPLAFLLGVPHADVGKVATLLGQKTVFNEFVAYSHLSEMLKADPSWLSPRGRLIASYALCGFANFGSIGIQIAGYSSLAPERLGDLSRLGLRAMVGGLLTTCLVACVAGVLA